MGNMKNIIDFWEFINEKQGVITRMDMNKNVDIFDISKIVNNFINHISQHPDEKYITTEHILDKFIRILYDPNMEDEQKKGGYTDSVGNISIYAPIDATNMIEVKYILVHEMVHSLQIIKDKKKDKTSLDKLNRLLTSPSLTNIMDADDDSKYFLYLIYREDINEVPAWSNNAYMYAFKYKSENPNMSNEDIVKNVLSDIYMDTNFYNSAIKYIRNNDNIFFSIINILVGNFSEISKRSTPHSFDDRVFKLDVVKRLRKDIKNIISPKLKVEEMQYPIMQLIQIYMDELKEHKDIIIDSFLTQLDYWFKRAQVKLGKAISLGIEDATPLINN